MSCHHNSTVVQALTRDRVAQLRHDARPRRHAARAARRRTGWLLVSVGLRLAVGR
jgi:hypothetical protein